MNFSGIIMKSLCCYVIQFCIIVSSVWGNMQICDIVHPPKSLGIISNCTLACIVHLKDFASEDEEVAICERNTSFPVTCTTRKDCTKYYAAASCEQIPCFCESEPGSRAFYLSKPHRKVAVSQVCIVSSKGKHPDLPLIPFPWPTLLVVFGILFLLAMCLVILRWLSPYIRARQAKRAEQCSGDIDLQDRVDNIRLFPSIQQERICVNARHERPRDIRLSVQSSAVRPSHTRYTSCPQMENVRLSSSNILGEDLPPSYEVAMQAEPSYGQMEVSQDGSEESKRNDVK